MKPRAILSVFDKSNLTELAQGLAVIMGSGGSVWDDDALDGADRLELALVFTGVRHFRH